MKRTRVWAVLLLLFAALVAAPWGALAQRTGGSFGGSRWGSGSSTSRPSSGSYSRPSSGSYSRPSSSTTRWNTGSSSSDDDNRVSTTSTGYGGYNGGSSGGGGGSSAVCVCAIVFFILLFVIVMAIRNRKNGGGGPNGPMQFSPPPGGPGYGGAPPGGYNPDTFSLGALAIAFDATVRAQLQGELDALAARSQQSDDPNGLDTLAREASRVLARYLDAAYFTHHAISEGLGMQQAQQQFEQAANVERGRFLVETVRGDAGGVRRINAPKSTARAEEGGGFVAVTVLVCRREKLNGFRPPTDRATLAHDLQVILAGPTALQAMEVIWVPSDPADIMSSAEMAVVFPTLKPLSPDARVGRRACASCKSVYAAELGRCPNCGAPAQ